jgi:hypothetical protein
VSATHNNHGLFSDHYLKHHLPELTGEALERARADQQALREIYEAGVPIAEDADEQVCEQRILRPALARLGFEMDPQPILRTVESTFKPDYALFADREALDEAVAAGRGEDGYFDNALAVGEAKRWGRDLGAPERDEDAAEKRQHPGAQIRRYLLDSNVRWGILTNGKLWRIYERERSRAGFRYYEVDLPALLEADVQDFRFFWLLFRRDSFLPDDSGSSPIEQVYEGSRRYWLGLTDRLRGRVYDALEQLMTGMIEGSPDLSEDDLPAVHEASLIVLYRLLFCFYAEARDLLPTGNAIYRDHHAAQTKLLQVAARRDTGGASWPRSGRALWQWFRDLSRIINDGDPDETGVPEYDGGLFDPEEWPLLGDPQVAVPDVHMAEAIDRIGRDWDSETDRRAFLDYSELTVRELGSIYEGLLEMQPRFEGGEVELLTDRGERKATGSYYTPEYIVDYIVTNTLDPLLTDAAAQVASRLPDFEARIAEQQAAIDDRPDDHPENLKNLRKIDDLKLELLEPYFELMVLDPAMGSGHFLVAASEVITEAIVNNPHHFPPYQPEDKKEKEDENLYYKRRVVERCLYGVDLNPLAVELAKLSLWLHTVEFGKPLSFLKHHLREGNSLIGARLAEMHRLPNGPTETSGQLNLFTQSFMPEATRMLQAFNLIERMPTDTLAQEREKEAAWDEIERRRERFRQVANVWLSTYFGNTVDDADYARAVDALGNPPAFEDLEREEWFIEADRLAAEHSFFHWELEFPDAFFTEQGPKRETERGFDAVVGNPPWERIKLQEREFFATRDEKIAKAPRASERRKLIARLEDTNPELYEEYRRAKQRADDELAWARDSGQYPLMGRGDTNLYAVMTERGRDILKFEAYMGFVVPSGIATDKTTSEFFADLVEEEVLRTLLDFENKAGLFPHVHREQKFSVIVFSGGVTQRRIDCGFFLHTPADVGNPDRSFALRPDDLALFNPNTLTCPIIRTRREAEVMRAIYQSATVLIRHDDDGELNPWGIRYLRMFDMTNDSDLFVTSEELQSDRFYPVEGGRWKRGGTLYQPLYEGKMIHHFDHRYADAIASEAATKSAQASEVNKRSEKTKPSFAATPRYWVPADECALPDEAVASSWYLGFRDVVNPNNVRTMIAAGIPAVGAGNTLPLLLARDAAVDLSLLLANLCAFPFDFVVRRKVGSRHLNFYVLEQLPVLPPGRYEEEFGGVRLADFVSERVLELTYTAHDMAGFARDMGYVDEKGEVREPFEWDEDRRLHLRCQLDALYFHLYDLDREDAAYILDTFPIVREHDMNDFGHYRTKDLILHYYNAYAAGDMSAWVEG